MSVSVPYFVKHPISWASHKWNGTTPQPTPKTTPASPTVPTQAADTVTIEQNVATEEEKLAQQAQEASKGFFKSIGNFVKSIGNKLKEGLQGIREYFKLARLNLPEAFHKTLETQQAKLDAIKAQLQAVAKLPDSNKAKAKATETLSEEQGRIYQYTNKVATKLETRHGEEAVSKLPEGLKKLTEAAAKAVKLAAR